MAPAPLTAVRDFFGIKMSDFRNEWNALTDTDKAQIKEGIGNGSLTY